MGRVRTKTVKKSSRVVIERYVLWEDDSGFPYKQEDLGRSCNHSFQASQEQDCRFFNSPYEAYPKGTSEGYLIEAPGRRKGTSTRRMDFVPDISAIKTDLIEVDKETIDMLVALGMGDLPGVVKAAPEPQVVPAATGFGRGGGGGGFARRY